MLAQVRMLIDVVANQPPDVRDFPIQIREDTFNRRPHDVDGDAGREAIGLLRVHPLQCVQAADQRLERADLWRRRVPRRGLLGRRKVRDECCVHVVGFRARELAPRVGMNRGGIDKADAMPGVMQGTATPSP